MSADTKGRMGIKSTLEPGAMASPKDRRDDFRGKAADHRASLKIIMSSIKTAVTLEGAPAPGKASS